MSASLAVARLLYGLAEAAESGVCLLTLSARGIGRPRVELEQGWIHAIDLEPAAPLLGRIPPRGEDALAALLSLDATAAYDPFLRSTRRGACVPFQPAMALRTFFDGLQAASAAPDWRQPLAGIRVILARPPHPSSIAVDERPLVAFLAAAPRTLDEVEAARLCPPSRAARLLAFLSAMGALAPPPATAAMRAAYARLALADGASRDEVRRAFHRLARELHPDRHPGASTDELRELESRFAELTEAYRQLV